MKQVVIVGMVLLFSSVAMANPAENLRPTEYVQLSENIGSLDIWWSDMRQNLDSCPSWRFKNWILNYPDHEETSDCDHEFLYLTYEEASIVHHWTRQFEGFFSTPIIYDYSRFNN